MGSIPGLGRYPGGEHGNPLQYSCLETPHGQRSLKDYSSQGRTELDMTAATQQHKTLILNSVLQFYLFHIINLRCVCFTIQPGLWISWRWRSIHSFSHLFAPPDMYCVSSSFDGTHYTWTSSAHRELTRWRMNDWMNELEFNWAISGVLENLWNE